ncbi:hypothetical protein HHI36_014718 [Cryptolaemus montrouzieri]|uniref:Uncharacterized protein n=1 Tax=Cryptolaemus montrouzieri TaxID=559131 RepID=A0ABD2N3Q8_9CUCU
MFYQQDGAPPTKQEFGENWIATNGSIRWLARSPDFTPLDFFVSGYLKNCVYATAPTTRADLEDRVRRAIGSIRPEQLTSVTRNLQERIQMCVDNNGQHFEQFL